MQLENIIKFKRNKIVYGSDEDFRFVEDDEF